MYMFAKLKKLVCAFRFKIFIRIFPTINKC